MKSMKTKLLNKMIGKMACSLGQTSIKISEKAMKQSCFLGVYETKIPMELLKDFNNK